MARMKCPRCATIVDVAPGASPVCPNCGFGAGASTPPPPPPPPPPAPAMGGWTPTQPPMGMMSPPAPAAFVPGKVISPAVAILLHVVTLGIYGIFYWWNRTREIDQATPGGGRAHRITKNGILLSIIALLAAIVLIVFAVATFFSVLISNSESGSEEDILSELLAAGILVVLLLVVVVCLALAGRIMVLIGQYRLWTQTRDAEQRLGFAKLVSPGLLLALSIVALVIGGGGNAGDDTGVAIVQGVLGLLSLVLYFFVVASTQSHLNSLWQGRPA